MANVEHDRVRVANLLLQVRRQIALQPGAIQIVMGLTRERPHDRRHPVPQIQSGVVGLRGGSHEVAKGLEVLADLPVDVLDQDGQEFFVESLPGSMLFGQLPAYDAERGESAEQNAVECADQVRPLPEESAG
jgi:hypothetical protein